MTTPRDTPVPDLIRDLIDTPEAPDQTRGGSTP